jgi:hypothetical protein
VNDPKDLLLTALGDLKHHLAVEHRREHLIDIVSPTTQ